MRYMQHADFNSRLPTLHTVDFYTRNEQRIVIAILIATVAYQTILCFFNTHIFST